MAYEIRTAGSPINFPSMRDAEPKTLYELIGLYEAMTTFIECGSAFLTQSRFETDGKMNPAGEYIDEFVEALSGERDVLMNKIIDFKPATADEADLQYRLFIRFEPETPAMSFEQLIELLRRGQAAVANAS
ncbi:hypothetical protein [Rhizobium leguminosarum]|uniref:hypothetical protein n=1 Tax=Rhizobium leguminosarum TaxID=384 RepID=UPI0010300C56|nr:hypothetical protein [Rhizobium leguminosarum]TAV53076.1 hypothetical protein ELI29_08195 [Rhizobium leguminosarum]